MVLTRGMFGHPMLSFACGPMMPMMMMMLTSSKPVKKKAKFNRRSRPTSSSSVSDDVVVVSDDFSSEDSQPTHTVQGEPIGAPGVSHSSVIHCANPDADHDDHETNQKFNEACHRKIMDFLVWATFPMTSSLSQLQS